MSIITKFHNKLKSFQNLVNHELTLLEKLEDAATVREEMKLNKDLEESEKAIDLMIEEFKPMYKMVCSMNPNDFEGVNNLTNDALNFRLFVFNAAEKLAGKTLV